MLQDVSLDLDESETFGASNASSDSTTSALARFLQAAGVGSNTSKLLCRSVSMQALADLLLKDRWDQR